MRDRPTKVEELCAEALSEAFKKEGHSVSFPDRDKKDKPDILIEIAGVRVACECTQIPPSYIYQFQHKHYTKEEWPDGEILSTTWPNEPHEWVADAISKKTPHVSGYLSRTGAKEAWLLLHSPPETNQFFIEYEKTWIPWALRHGAKMVDHPFTQIYLWTPQSGIQLVYVLKNEINSHSELGIDFSKGYPTLCVNRTTLKIVTTRNEYDKPNSYCYEFDSRISNHVEPIDVVYAQHSPANRNAVYKYEVVVWNDHAEVRTTIEFTEPDEKIELEPMKINGLSPNTDYWHHSLHEFRSPKSLNTIHHVQPK